MINYLPVWYEKDENNSIRVKCVYDTCKFNENGYCSKKNDRLLIDENMECHGWQARP